jgi:ribosomal protein S18 acetylase RimI-like enzyme
MMDEIEVRRATIADLDAITPLFDAYRRFYRQASDLEGARRFLRERLERDESVIFLALCDAVAIGFTQLYPSFSSGAMSRIFVLNDLFVSPQARRRGVGSALLQAAAHHGRRAGALRLVLSTEITNSAARSLYEYAGWMRDTVFCVYQLPLLGR